MTYEIPLDGYDGRVSLQTLARRVSRACVHYLQVRFLALVGGVSPLYFVCRPMSFLSCGIVSSFTTWRKLRMACGTQSCRHASNLPVCNPFVQVVLVVFGRQP